MDVMWYVLTLILLAFGPIHAFLPTQFIWDFTQYYYSKSIVLHVKSTHGIENELLAFFREFNTGQEYVSVVSSYSQCNTFKENVDLQVVLFDELMVEHTLDCFMYRQRYNKEPWILYTKLEIEDVTKLLEKAELDLDDEIYVAIEDSNMLVNIWEIYKISNETMIESINLGSWRQAKGLDLTQVHKWYRRRNLKGHHFLTTSLVETPFTSKIELNPMTGKYEIEGSFADLMHSLRDIMNFTYTLEPPADNNWGGQQPDGSWNGMMNLVQKELVDFAPTSLIQTMERELATDWTLPLVFSHLSIFIKNPTNTYNYTAYLEPLTYLSWAIIVVFLFAVPPVLFWVSKYAEEFKGMKLEESYGAVYVALLLLGSSHNPVKYSTRIVFVSMLLAAALIYWHWEAMLVSYLATRKTVMPFTTVTDMYLNTDFRLALIPSTTYEDNFKYSKEPLWQRIYKERLQPYLTEYSSYENYLSDMVYFIREDFSTALIDGYIPITSTKDYMDCKIVVTEGKYFKRPYAWTFQKHSPYLDIFNFYIQELIQKGQWNAIINKYQAQPQVCPDLSGMPIEFANCFTAFLCLIGGAFLGILFLCIEYTLKPFRFMQVLKGEFTDIPEDFSYENLQKKVMEQSFTIDRLKSELSIYRLKFPDF